MPFPTLASYGWTGRWEAAFAPWPDGKAVPGRVVRHDSSALLLALPDGVAQAAMAPGLEPTTVGDWVVVQDGVVTAVMTRSSLLRRLDADGEREQLLAANVDLVVIVAGLDRPVKSGRLQRAITMSWDSGATPLVLLSKSDLADQAETVRSQVELENPGVETVLSSALEGEGVDALRELIVDQTAVVLGESGAGKSTLINALITEEVAATGAVRSGDARGRHTTTSRQLHPLPGGGSIIDTPGLRAVGLVAGREALEATFVDIEEFAAACRFRDCAHIGEPGCAVGVAVHDGSLPAERLSAWIAMVAETRAGELRADDYSRRRAERRSGSSTKAVQKRKEGS